MKIGSLFSGYSGLDMAVSAVTGAETAWFVEFDAAPSKILAHHYPMTPNYGDITQVKWTPDCPECGEPLAVYWRKGNVPDRAYYCPQHQWFDFDIRFADANAARIPAPVEVLTGGFPCQDVSLAGRRAGMKDGTRSGLWTEFAKAIDALRPELVVIENVRGLLSAEAHSSVEPCPWCVGDGDGEPPLRALGAVLGDLSDLGYDAEWCGLRAADAGAPHGRYRVFITAYPRGGRDRWRPVASGRGAGAGADVATYWTDPGAHGASAEDAYLTARRERWVTAPGQEEGRGAWADAGGRDRAPVADARGDEPERRGIADYLGSAPAEGEGHGAERQWVRDTARDSGSTDWGHYEPAIRRWENVTGRASPAPTRPDGRDGQHRLNAAFVEWMMGLPAGWVTDPAIGLTRNEQLKALGNGVVPQQAELALRTLLRIEAAA